MRKKHHGHEVRKIDTLNNSYKVIQSKKNHAQEARNIVKGENKRVSLNTIHTHKKRKKIQKGGKEYHSQTQNNDHLRIAKKESPVGGTEDRIAEK